MGRFVCLLAVAGLLAVPTGGDAMRGKKEKLKAKVNGKAFKARIDSVAGTHDAFTNALVLTGLAQKGGLRGSTVKNISVTCVVALDGVTFPVTTTDCVGNFTVTTVRFPGRISNDGWAGSGISLTVTSFDGTRVNGTFEGTLPASDISPAPANVAKGKFAVDLAQ